MINTIKAEFVNMWGKMFIILILTLDSHHFDLYSDTLSLSHAGAELLKNLRQENISISFPDGK